MKLRIFTTVLMLQFVVIGSLMAKREFPLSAYDSLSHRSVYIFSDQLNSSLSDPDAWFAASHYVGTQKMTRAAIDKIREYNPDFIHLHYKLGITVDSIANYMMVLNGEFNYSNRSPESNWGQVREHEDWFWPNSTVDGWVIHQSRRMVMNIDNFEFRDWWVGSCIQEMEANGADGVFADTYHPSSIAFGTNDPNYFSNVTKLSGDWLPKLNDYGMDIHQLLDDAGFYFFPNIGHLQTSWENSSGAHYAHGEYMHGAMLEGWGNWSSPNDAIMSMEYIRKNQDSGVFLHGQGVINRSTDMNPNLTTPQKRMWMVGLYLLANLDHLYLSIYDAGNSQLSNSRTHVLWYPEYELDLGPYLSKWETLSELKWNRVYRRDYEKGFVLVNFDKNPIAVPLDRTMYLAEDSESTTHYWSDSQTGEESVELKYTALDSLEMPGLSAVVLLYESPDGDQPGCSMPLKGDFNGNGSLAVTDVISMLLSMRDGSDDPCLDFNGDGKANIQDAIALMLYIAFE